MGFYTTGSVRREKVIIHGNTADIAITATGTAEVGGWTTRELLSILDGLEGLELIGADVGELHYQASLHSSEND